MFLPRTCHRDAEAGCIEIIQVVWDIAAGKARKELGRQNAALGNPRLAAGRAYPADPSTLV
jgi:hypothetical protein